MQKQIAHFVMIIAVLSIFTGIMCIVVWAAWLRRVYPDYMNIDQIISTAVSFSYT